MPVLNENGRTLAGVIAELKDELREFVQVRFDMLRAELRDKVKTWRMALPLILTALVLLATAWLVLTAALVAVIAAAFYPSRLAYFFALAIVGVAYTLGGGIGAAFALRGLKAQGLMPRRTAKVLNDDKIWLQTEARSQI